MEDKQVVFTNFMDEFVKLDINQKNKEIVEKLKLILLFLIDYSKRSGIEYEFLRSKEISDIEDGKGTNDDYLEAMMVYLHNIEELIGIILQNN